MKKSFTLSFITLVVIILLVQCNNTKEDTPVVEKESYGGFEDNAAWGNHLVTIGGCHDCHTPKKMTPMGPVIDSSLLLAGHMPNSPVPDVNRKQMQEKGLVVSSDLTAWVGPWGVSFTANLTSDDTGIGTWSEEQLRLALREGKYKGLPGSRTLLPPMPWEMFSHFTDAEIKAIYVFLKSTKPINNIVPAPLPPEN